ncbi:MAG: NifB/NifX family molybdenum-iron cluster-binding protein [Gammaproteobacteria bacterium]|jgi:predicted Fe-Mo cluster-binding NifX family protein
MKIAIAVNSQGSDAQVSAHAARAPFYVLYDENGTFLESIENPYSSVERGAAPRAAQLLQEHGVNTLVAGEFGDRFIAKLEEHNIAAVLSNGLVCNVIQQVLV